MDSWYLLFCKAKQEQRAKINLENQGIESFFPVYTNQSISRGRVTLKQAPLFPNYLFVKINKDNGQFSAVKNTRGVSGFVSYGASFQTVPEHLILQLQSLNEQETSSSLPKSGDVVYLNSGSFKDVRAIYQEPDGDKRSILLVNLLNKKVKMSVENKAIST